MREVYINRSRFGNRDLVQNIFFRQGILDTLEVQKSNAVIERHKTETPLRPLCSKLAKMRECNSPIDLTVTNYLLEGCIHEGINWVYVRYAITSPDQHRAFFAMLQSVHIGAVDSDVHLWAIMRTGAPSFMTSPNEKTLMISSQPLPGEPKDLNFMIGAKTSVVGIEFETQHRNRLIATIDAVTDAVLSFHVDQSYGNCPKYIQIRLKAPVGPTVAQTPVTSAALSEADKTQITHSDTFLIVSHTADLGDDPRAGVDINHRGGMPGFVTVLDDHTIQFPDYKGNSFYKSYGNILTDNRVGLQFIDFETGARVTHHHPIGDKHVPSLAQAVHVWRIF